MSFISRLFGSKSEPPERSPGNLTQRLEKLELEAEKAGPGYVGTSYNRAGDVALRSGDEGRALGYYGRAIDAFLEDEQRDAARGVANKIIRVRPGAVRTLCTLTWLDLGAKHSATALLHLRDYVSAAREVEQFDLAASQIREMARLIPDSEFLDAVGDALDGLDFPERADEVREWAGDGGSPDAISDPDELAAACLQAAVGSNTRSAQGDESEDDAVRDASADDPASDPEDEPDGDGEKKSRKYRWD